MSESADEQTPSEPTRPDDAPPGRHRREWLVELFVAFNLAFLAVDIYIAHAANDFANVLEWIPVYFSAFVPLLLVPGIVTGRFRRGAFRWLGLIVGALAILVGVVGMFLHLESAFFELFTLKSLVYSAPFVAPLAYAGVGLLLLLNRLENQGWAEWVVFLSLGGFVGNFALSLLDHAQNGFFEATEYIPVVAAGLGVGFLATALFARRDRLFLKITMGILALNVAVGLAGFGLHLSADLASPGAGLAYNFLYGAPIFAPLLFPNIAMLAAIGLWDMLAETDAQSPAKPAAEPTVEPAGDSTASA